MDCPDLQFHSQVADWNVVSYATQYASVVSEPAKLVTFEGTGIPQEMRGALFVRITGTTRDLLSASDLDLVAGLRKGQRFAVLIDPKTSAPARDASGKLILLDAPRKTKQPAGFDRMVAGERLLASCLPMAAAARKCWTRGSKASLK